MKRLLGRRIIAAKKVKAVGFGSYYVFLLDDGTSFCPTYDFEFKMVGVKILTQEETDEVFK